jgi:hypothetical protein
VGRARKGIASLLSRGEEALKRGWFGVNALRRIAVSEDHLGQLAKEKKHFQAHKQAQAKRRAVAAQVDAAAERYGSLLGWHSVRGLTTEPECKQAHGKNFQANRPPSIGYPGAVHPHCRCSVVAPWENGRMLR